MLLDRRTREVVRNGERISLTRTEYCLLERLMRDAGKVVRRESLIESIWGSGQPVTDNSLDAFVRLLRNKVEGNGYQKLIHTVRGVGYVMRQEYQG